MEKAPSLYRRSLRSTSEVLLIEGFVSTRSTEPDLSVEVVGGPARATVDVQVADVQPRSMTLDGSGCGRLRLGPHAGGESVSVLFEGCEILRGTTPPSHTRAVV